MLRAPRAPWVHYHNIIGVVSKSSWFGEPIPSDGLVTVESAMMPDVESEIMVESKHQDIHRQPRAILEVRRILVNHLRELSQYPQMMSILKLPKNSSYSGSGPLIPLEEALAKSPSRPKSNYSQIGGGRMPLDGSLPTGAILSLSDRDAPVIQQASRN
jgi:hypothetical protein